MGLSGRFWRSDSGNVALIFGIVVLVLASLVGVALDLSRASTVRQNVQHAMDSAVLGAARHMVLTGNASAAEAVGDDVFRQNLIDLGIRADCPAARVTVDLAGSTIDGQADCRLPLTFAALISDGDLEVGAAAESLFNVARVELAMMLDVSGSMSGQKLSDLKSAGGELIDTLIPVSGEGPIRISLVPYATALNAGSFGSAATGLLHSASSGSAGCVSEREGIHAFTDVAPATAPVGTGASDCPDATVEPLSDDTSILHAGIDSLSADGWTAGHLGIAWSWYTLSNEWASVWPAGRRPDPDGPNVRKIAILMTDGAFNTHYGTGLGDSNAQSAALCDAMKADGVEIYAVAFAAPASGQAVLSACATSPELYFNAANGSELRAAYDEIAARVGQVRLVR